MQPPFEAEGPEEAPGPEGRRPRVLVAEDDDDMRELLATILRQDGYDVVVASSGADLLDAMGDSLMNEDQGLPVDLILTDLRMPGLDGMQALAGLRYVDRRTPVIMVTAFASERVHQEATRLGAAAVIEKPFDVDRLRRIVRSVLL